MKRCEIFDVAVVLTTFTMSMNVAVAGQGCPSSDDREYAIHVGDTWESLGARAYCRNGPHDRTQAALALYEYNRGRVGQTITDFLPDGKKICLPQHLHGRFFDAELCDAAPKTASTPSTAAKVALEPICGNGVREGKEVCDGAELGGATCAAMGLPLGNLVCRGDCGGFDASVCMPKSPPSAPASSASRPPPPPPPTIPFTLGVDASVGLMFPLSTPGAPTAYGTIGMARIGARFDVGPLQIIASAIGGTGGGTTLLDGHDADLDVQTLGGGLQVGIPRKIGGLRVVPGAEAQRLFLHHRMDARPPFGPDYRETSGAITILGAFTRGEYRFQRVPRLAASLELALGYVPGEVAGLPISTRVQMKTLAGVTYHAF